MRVERNHRSVALTSFGISQALGQAHPIRERFKTTSGMKYTVMVRDKLGGGDAKAIQFATTPDAPLNARRFTGNGKTAKVYLQPVGDAGFIQVVREKNFKTHVT